MKRTLACLMFMGVMGLIYPAGALPPGVTCKAGQTIIQGTNGNDMLTGPGGYGYNFDVCLIGHGGNDVLKGSTQADNLWGMDGQDELIGREAADVLKGGTSDDQIWDGPNPTGNGDLIDGGGGLHDEHYHCSTNAQYDTRTATTEYWTNPVPGYCVSP